MIKLIVAGVFLAVVGAPYAKADDYKPCMSGQYCPGPAAEYVAYQLRLRLKECRYQNKDAVVPSVRGVTWYEQNERQKVADAKRKAALAKCEADYDRHYDLARVWIGQMAWAYVLERIEKEPAQ